MIGRRGTHRRHLTVQYGTDSRNPNMNITRFVLLTAAAAALSTTASAQLPQSRVLTLDAAQTIAMEAMAKCRADGYKVTVLVVDALNAPKAMVRDDGATAST